MTTPVLTEDTLKGLEELVEKATPKKWKDDGSGDVYTQGEKYQEYHVECKFSADATCIVALHNAAAELIRGYRLGISLDKDRKP